MLLQIFQRKYGSNVIVKSKQITKQAHRCITMDLEETLPTEVKLSTELVLSASRLKKRLRPISMSLKISKSESSSAEGYTVIESPALIPHDASPKASPSIFSSLSRMPLSAAQVSDSIACGSSQSSMSAMESARAARKSSPQCSTVIKSRPSSPATGIITMEVPT